MLGKTFLWNKEILSFLFPDFPVKENEVRHSLFSLLLLTRDPLITNVLTTYLRTAWCNSYFLKMERETCGLNIERPMLCAKKLSFIFKIHRRILTAYLVFYWYLRLISSSTHRWFKNVRCILGISILILDF